MKDANFLVERLPQDCAERKDPITSLIYFAHERDAIRKRKESRAPRPWTTDLILHEARFTNIRREYDWVSKFIFKWADVVAPAEEELFFNLLFARHCNKAETLSRVGPVLTDDDPEENINKIRAVKPMYATPYVCPGQFGKDWGTREDWIFKYFPTVAKRTIPLLSHGRSISDVVERMDDIWGFRNWFSSTQALLDLAYLRPDLIDPKSEIYVGPGAIPALYLIRTSIWRLLQVKEVQELCETFAGVEHTLCEWTKYLKIKYGFRPITKRFKYYPRPVIETSQSY